MNTCESAPRRRRTQAPKRPPTHAELLEVVALHVHKDGKCAKCGTVRTKEQPLCAPAAQALKLLASTSMASPARSLSALPVKELRRIAFEHRPDAHGRRCQRCGLAYGAQAGPRKACPTLRDIRRELGIRSLSVTVTAAAARGTAVCKGQAELWTVDRNHVEEWELAVAACHACPMLEACRKTLEQQLADGQAPPSMIVAGELLDATGKVVDDLHAHGRRRNAFAGRRSERTSKYRRQPTAVA